MNKQLGPLLLIGGILILTLSNLQSPFLSVAIAQERPEKTLAADEQQLIQKIKEEIMKELKEGDFLREQINLGIKDYIKQQQQAQMAARAEQERLANEKAKNVRRVSATRDHIFGDPNATISLIEYSDFECPYCKGFHPTPKQIVKEFDGKVNWVYRHFPLSFHNPGAQKQAEASECANELGGNDAFWKYADAVYARTKSGGKGFPDTNLVPLAKEIGLDAMKFQECLNSGRHADRVKEDLEEGQRIGVTGTPASILLHNKTGETKLASGARPLASFKAAIEQMLK